jgi:Sulfotransferase family
VDRPQSAPRVTRAALKRYWPKGRVDNRLQPLPEHGCIYVKNAKAGSSTTLLWLHRIHTGDHAFTPRDNSIHAEHRLPGPQDVGWDVVLRMLGGAAFRFSFVRDPIRRVESAYLDKIKWAPPHRLWRRTQLQQVLGLPEDPDRAPTFEEFVAAIELQDPLEMDVHWRPQHLNLMDGLVEYDLIGRVENFSTDLARVREATGMPDVPVEAQNVSVRRTGSLFDGQPDLLHRVREVYARDLELYGY